MCLPRPPEIWALPLNVRGQGTRVPVLSPPCQGRSAHSVGREPGALGGRKAEAAAVEVGFRSLSAAAWATLPPPRLGFEAAAGGEEDAKELLPAVSIRRRGRPRTGAAGRTWDLEIGPRKQGPGVALSSRAGAARPTFREEGSLPPDRGALARGAMLRGVPPGSRLQPPVAPPPGTRIPPFLPPGATPVTPAPRPRLLPSAPPSAGPRGCGGRPGPPAPPRRRCPAAPRRPWVPARCRCCTWCGPARLRGTSRGPCPPAASPGRRRGAR